MDANVLCEQFMGYFNLHNTDECPGPANQCCATCIHFSNDVVEQCCQCSNKTYGLVIINSPKTNVCEGYKYNVHSGYGCPNCFTNVTFKSYDLTAFFVALANGELED
jgi:hypothetical protein